MPRSLFGTEYLFKFLHYSPDWDPLAVHPVPLELARSIAFPVRARGTFHAQFRRTVYCVRTPMVQLANARSHHLETMPLPEFDNDRSSARADRRTARPTHRAAASVTRASSGAAPKRLIRSDEVRYPGIEERIGADREYEEWRSSGRRLRPVRDTGIMVERRAARDRRQSARVRRNRTVAAVIAVAVLVVAVVGWRAASDRFAATHPFAPKRASAPAGVTVATAAPAEPTPMFAAYRSLQLRLPVAPVDLTEVGFHQASYSYALPMTTPLPDADMTAAKKLQTTNRDLTKQEQGPAATLTGSVLRMWRDRPGQPDTAVDIGADPGAKVFSPVTGTVVLVKEYDLYNKYPDTQVHIQPDGFPNVDVVLIHFQDPTVRAGDRVEAGVTQVGSLRKLSDKMNLQLRSYTSNGGNHVHLQVNDKRHPDYDGLKGAIAVPAR